MWTEKVTVKHGEWFPFDKHSWDDGGSTNPDAIIEGRKTILKMVKSPSGWRYSPSWGSSFEVVKVGMYDGWPYWKPTPAIGYIGPMGSIEVAFFDNLGPSLITRSSNP